MPYSVRRLVLGAVHLRTGRRRRRRHRRGRCLLRRRRTGRQLWQSERVRRVRQRQLVVDDAVDEVNLVGASLEILERRPRLVVLETVGVEKLVRTRRAPLLRREQREVRLARLPPIEVVDVARLLHQIASSMMQVVVAFGVF